MLTVTDAALAHIAKLREENIQNDDISLRLIWEDDELRFMADTGRVGDTDYEHEGKKVLMVDERIASVLENNTLDVDGDALALK